MILKINSLVTGYGKKKVLNGIDLFINDSEIVAIIGPNGCGKSTLLKSIVGILPTWSGTIKYKDLDICNYDPAKCISIGMTFCPQGVRVFNDLSVIENLEIGGLFLSRKERAVQIEIVLTLFPVLRDRQKMISGQLSGGEQQMLAIARALISKPSILLLDEPSLGLSPEMVKLLINKIKSINSDYKTSIMIVEQKVYEALNICNRVYSLKLGSVAFTGDPKILIEDKTLLKDLFL